MTRQWDESDDEFLAELAEAIKFAQGARLTGDDLARYACGAIRDRYQGQQHYIRKGRGMAKETADSIRREFDGTNAAEIMERYSVSRSTVYRICASK